MCPHSDGRNFRSPTSALTDPSAERQTDHLLAEINIQEQLVEHRKDVAVDAHQSWQAYDRTPHHAQHANHHDIVRDAHQRFLTLDLEVKRAERVVDDLKQQIRRAQIQADKLAEAIGSIQRTREREDRGREDEEHGARHRRESDGHHYCSSSRTEPSSTSRSHHHHHHPRSRHEERRPSSPVEPRTYYSRANDYEQQQQYLRPRYEERRPSIPIEPRTYHSQHSKERYEFQSRPRYEERRPSFPQMPPPPAPRPIYEERRPSYAQAPPPHLYHRSTSSRREHHSQFHCSAHNPPHPRYEERRPPPSFKNTPPFSSYSRPNPHLHRHSPPPPHPKSPRPGPPPPQSTPTPNPISPPSSSSPTPYTTWYTSTHPSLSSPNNPNTTFPYPPPLPASSPLHTDTCRSPSTTTTTTNIATPLRRNKACDCALREAFLRAGVQGTIKKEMRRWHPDRFAKIQDAERREEWQRAAGEVFVVLGGMEDG